MFSVSALYLASVPYLPSAFGLGQILGTSAKYQGGYWKHQVILTMYSTNIRRTPDACITDGARPNTHASWTFHVQALSFRGCQWNERDMCAVHAWYERGASVDGRGRARFRTDACPAHSHAYSTHKQRTPTHYAHRRTVVRRKNFEPFKTQKTHKPPSTHIHLQSLTVHVRSTDELLYKGPVTQRKRMNHARITHRFSFLRGACVVCVIRRWNERGLSVIVSVCASKAVCAWFEFWTVQNFSDAQLCVGVRNSCVGVRCLCVEYAWLCAGHASAVSAYASELVRNRARPRPSTDAPRSYHAWTAHISRSFHWHSLTITYKTDE